MGVTTSALDNITTQYSVRFKNGYTSMTSELGWKSFADEVTSGGRQTTYPIRARPARMHEWVGDRIVREAQVYGYTLLNRKFAAAEKVALTDLEDDNYGLYNNSMTDLGKAAARLPFDEVVTALINGTSNLCFDGQYFFDTDHPVDLFGEVATTYANLLTSQSLTHANVDETRTAMSVQVDQYGNNLGVRPNTLFVPAALRKTGEEIVRATLIPRATGGTTDYVGAQNVLAGQLNLIVLPELDTSSATTWYMADLTKGTKPLFWQWRVRPLFQRHTDLNSEYVMKHDEILYGAKARGAAGYTLPQLMYCNQA